MNEHILEMRSITKTYPGVTALKDVTFEVRPGEIHAICGENGAGKSTLMKVLSGVEPHGSYEGEIHYRGEEVRFSSVNDSEAKGIVIIHQELALVPHLSVAENIFLGNEQSRAGIIDWHNVNARAAELLGKVGLDENPVTPVAYLGVGKQQLVEIAKALSKNVDLLILDEPTAALNDTDSEHLLGLIRGLRDEGVTCIIISHKLEEIASVADRTTVIRDGATIETITMNEGEEPTVGRRRAEGGQSADGSERAEGSEQVEVAQGAEGSHRADGSPSAGGSERAEGSHRAEDEGAVKDARQDENRTASTTKGAARRNERIIPRIIKGMVGRDMDHMYPERNAELGEEVFRVENWSVTHPTQPGRTVVDDVTLSVRAGEVVGIAGLMGAGRTELAMSIFGQSYGRDITGTVKMHGTPVRMRSVADAIDAGIAYVSEDRKRYGLNLIDDIRRNISAAGLKKLAPRGWIDTNREIQVAQDFRTSLNIKAPSVLATVGQLSGGNQQKVVLSKWLYTEPELLILDEPTRGVDVGAKYEIYSIINQLAEQGKAIIVISSELPEVLGVCDRVYTLSAGRLTGEVAVEDATQERLMELMTMEKE